MKAASLWPPARTFTLPRIAIISFLLVAVILFRDTWLPIGRGYTSAYKLPRPLASQQHGKPLIEIDTTPPPPPIDADADCKSLPGADKVMIILKTGATELYQKLPTHFVTTLKCVPNFVIYSDLNQSYANVQVHDAIAPVSEKIRKEHEDFKLYREIAKWQREGQDMSKLQGGSGWNLDKWKFLPMFHEVFETADDKIDWFVMIEADTSLSWLNLLLWLQKMDPMKPFYLGSQNVIGETVFAHGGSGIVVSRKAADIMAAARQNAGKEQYDESWEQETAKACCGDEILARAFLAVEVPLSPAWPLIQGEKISTIDFTQRHWCTPSLTWHHVTPIEVDQYWQFQLDWVEKHGWQKEYVHGDIFDHFVAPHVTVNRTSWNNLSKDKKFLKDYQQKAIESEELCAEACMREGDGECMQWMWTPGRCHLGREIRFGESDEREEQHWNCGWIQDRIEQLRKKVSGCDVQWQG
ncbi:hypothetical protein CERZMDRAFT_68814 [Cercospora zeae-maydis SCOH1-5]|uniref:N-acetylgalactosaminide beta-1,3-galactosyltransferase n=1 Tax=Cercospora zeae-maydis SCOH1-5 TaxID=717836 RepID=A0A6A6FDL7_9PEZI|nr:hypothetical protein CERZMDRAFT_68814 [Cercospora zeae-maydis SCOH1-5]